MKNESLEKAINVHQRGNFPQAIKAYEAILKEEDLPQVHFLLGTVLAEEKSYEAAEEHLTLALLTDTGNLEYLAILADVKFKLGYTEQAQHLVDRVLEQEAKHVVACSLKAELLYQEGKYNEAIITLNRIITNKEKHRPSFLTLVKCLEKQSRWEEMKPYMPTLEKWFPEDESFQEVRAAWYLATKQAGKAYPILVELTQKLSPSPKAMHLMAKYFASKKDISNASTYYKAVYFKDRTNLGLLKEYSKLLSSNERHPELEAFLREIYPDAPEEHQDEIKVLLAHAIIYGVQGKEDYSLKEALDIIEDSLAKNPNGIQENFNMANLYMAMAMPEKALPYFDKGLEENKINSVSESSTLFNSLYVTSTTAEEFKKRADRWADKYETAAFTNKFSFPKTDDPHRKLRIGFSSPDLCLHPVGYFIKHLFSHIDPQQFEIYCYMNKNVADELTLHFEKYSKEWNLVIDLSNSELAEKIYDDQIDILIDLAGHSSGNRLSTFAEKPAPIQCTWLGFAGTTGLKNIDYRLTDKITEPPELQQYSSEKLLYLPDGFHCYRPQYEFPEVASAPYLKNGYVTFGTFNNFAKASPELMELWAQILERVPNSKLKLKGKHLRGKETRDQFYKFFTDKGVDINRISTLPFFRSNIEHLNAYQEIDIALDTFPYNGTTTTCEALYMGVPIITCCGKTHVSRVSASLLHQVGLDDFVAHSPAEYVEKAVEKAADIQNISAKRQELRPQFMSSPLYDIERFTHNWQSALRGIWKDYCGNLA